MNDFTKEELEELKRCCNWVINCKDTHYTTITYGLPDKIQSLIDNYCEHEFDMTDWVNDSSGCRWYQCKKCEGRYR